MTFSKRLEKVPTFVEAEEEKTAKLSKWF